MSSLRDRSFDPKAWTRFGVVLLGLGILTVIIWFSTRLHHEYVEVPRLLSQRHEEPVGMPGLITTQVSALGPEAVPQLIEDLENPEALKRAKSVELLSAIDDPRVLPALAGALKDADLGVRLAAVAGLARTRDPKAAASLWPLARDGEEMLRLRAIVALGLVEGAGGPERLLALGAERQGEERYLAAWAAGYTARRLEIKGTYKMLPAAPHPDDGPETDRVQAEVDAVRAALDRWEDAPRNGRLLSELTSLQYSTWDYAHQIAFQIMATRGPKRIVQGIAPLEARPAQTLSLPRAGRPTRGRSEGEGDHGSPPAR
jgi:hypothetical protein